MEFSGFYKLNVDDNVKEKVDRPEILTDVFNEWLKTARDKVLATRGRNFNFVRDTTEVYSCLIKYFETDEEVYLDKIVDRLFTVLIDAKKKYDHLNEIKNNNLFISLVDNGNNQIECFLALFHNENYLNEHSYTKDTGLPFENTTFKASIVLLDNQYEVISMYISDTNTTIAKYWTESFLESIELLDDSKNSINAFNSIDRFMREKVYNTSKRDYYELRNDTIAYFKIKDNFNYDDFKSTIFNNYQPESSKLKLDDLKIELDMYRSKLNKSFIFDDAFVIDKNIIKARFKKTIPLHYKIDLLLKEDIDNLKDIIKAHKVENKKGLFIISESGYDEFSSSTN
jgi:hypothetical protein